MKILILILGLLSFMYAQQYTFLVKKYDKEIELEAKIIFNIADSSINDKVILFIPKITHIEKDIYSKFFTLGKDCNESNFIFVKKNIENENLCMNQNKIYFTNNYQKLLSNEEYLGAFFWNKSRPNIVFIKNRLKKQKIILPKSYNQFIEDL